MKYIILIFFVLTTSIFADEVNINMNKLNIWDFPKISLSATISSKFNSDIKFSKKDFTVTEDDFNIDNFEMKIFSPPLNIGLVLYTSGSIKPYAKHIKNGAIKFVSNVGVSDKIMIVEFSNSVIVSQKSTFNKNQLYSAINSIRPGGGTKLYDGLYKALERIQGRNKTIVLFTDGKDQRFTTDTNRYSQHSASDVIKLALEKKVNIHCIGVGSVDINMLKSISQKTHGKFFHTTDPKNIASLYQGIARYLTKQYFISYKTPNTKADGKIRYVRIKEKKSGVQGVLTYKIDKSLFKKISQRKKEIQKMLHNQNKGKLNLNTNVYNKVPGFKQKFNVKGVDGFKITGPTTTHLQRIDFEYDENGFIKSSKAVMTSEKHADTIVEGTEDVIITNDVKSVETKVNNNTEVDIPSIDTDDEPDVDSDDETDVDNDDVDDLENNLNDSLNDW